MVPSINLSVVFQCSYFVFLIFLSDMVYLSYTKCCSVCGGVCAGINLTKLVSIFLNIRRSS